MKKAFCIFLSLAMTLSIGTAAFAHDRNTAYNWYCKNNDDHTLPTLDGCFEFIKKYDAFYANEKAADEKVIYLTFDAGYENGNVAKVLDALDAHGAKGAFFILDNLIKRDPELVKRMSDGGHTVCNHTAKHHDMTKITDEGQFKKELTSLSDAYFALTGRDMAPFYRPPEGKFSEQNLSFAKGLGYKTIFWSFAYADWDNDKQPDPEKAFQKIMDHTHNGAVILLHPTSATNAAIMDRLLTEWERQGYRFGTLDELC